MVCYNAQTFFNCLDKLFTVPKYKLRHVIDDTDVISRAESEKRIFWMIFIFGLLLNLATCFMILIFISAIEGLNKFLGDIYIGLEYSSNCQ